MGVTVGFVARAAMATIGVWALANMLWLGRELVFVSFLAVLVALFLSIFVGRLHRLGMPRLLAALIVVVLLLAIAVGMWVLAWPTLREQFILIQLELPGAIDRVGGWIREQYANITGQVGRPDGDLQRELRDRLGREAVNIVAGALPLLNTLVGAVAGLGIVLVAGIYLTMEPKLYTRGLALLVPPAAREHVATALDAAGTDLRRWILGTAINMVAIGVLTTVVLAIMGIPAALALGVIAGLLEFVPIFGPVLAAVPAVAIALIISPADALWVVAAYIAIQQFESNILTPLVMKGAVELPPALTMLFQALMAILFGFMGLLVAVPVLVIVLVLVRRLYIEPLNGRRPER